MRQPEADRIPSWKQIRDYQLTAQVARAALSFRTEQEAERSRAPADVFVSYSSRDRMQARFLCTALEEADVAFFLDEKTIRSRDALPSALEAEIRKRKYYLLLLSKHSAASKWVTYEWALAKGLGCDVRMLRVDPAVVVPAPLSDSIS